MRKFPHTKKVNAYRIGVPHCFVLEGENFGNAEKVRLDEKRANVVWDPEYVTEFEDRMDTLLRFTSTPRMRREGEDLETTGSLTITVTNPDGDDPKPKTVTPTYG